MNLNHREATFACERAHLAIAVVAIALATGCTSDEVIGRREDAPATVRSTLGTVSWARGFGGPEDDTGIAVALDLEGNVVVGGYYVWELALDDTVLASEADFAGFVAKLDGESGAVRWALGAGLPEVLDLAVAPDGGVVVTGVHYQAFQLGMLAAPDVGEPAIWLAKLSEEGTPMWLRSFGSGSAGGAHKVDADALGNIFVGGTFPTSIDLGGGPTAALGRENNAYVAEFSPMGDLVWARTYPAEGAYQLAANDRGGVAVAGTFATSFSLDAFELVPSSTANAFVAVFAPSGDVSWVRTFGGAASAWGVAFSALAADVEGRYLLAGAFLGETELGTTGRWPYTHFTMAFSPVGDLEPMTTIPLWGGVTNDIASHPGGRILAGFVSAIEVDFGYGPTPGGMFLAEYDREGTLTAATTYGEFTALGSHNLTSVAALPDGQLATTGHFYETIDVAGQALTSHGGADVVVFKLTAERPLE